MKTFIKFILIASIFIAENLSAQTETISQGMDMKVYTKWMMAGVFVLFLIIFAVLIFGSSKEPSLSGGTTLQAEISPVNIFAGNTVYMPALSTELLRIRFILISALIIFSVILLLLIF
ncbi:MAG TPA: hypothetical protein VHP32_05875 [Ignavibacteria bacterium]|nr:hypothetical protein [Ignavibacteria bacterium]